MDGFRRLHRPPRGIVRGIAGAALFVSVLGPPVTPLHSPVHAARPLPPAGKVISRTGTFSGTGPGVILKRRPVTPAVRALPPRGTVITRAGVFSGTGPALTPLHQPVRARQPLPLAGQVTASSLPAVSSPAPFILPSQPAGIRTVFVRAGDVRSATGVYSGKGPAVTPLHSPVRAVPVRLPSGRAVTLRAVQAAAPPPVPSPIPPRAAPWRPVIPAAARGGWSRHSAGIYAGQGPALYPLRRPVKAQPANLQRGHAAATAAYVSPPAPVAGPALYPLHQPVRGRLPLPPAGHAAAIAALVVTLVTPTTGPPIPPRSQPVRAPIPARPRGGYTRNAAGTYAGTGPAPAPLRYPVTAALRVRPPAGKTAGREGVFSGTGPALVPLHTPVTARRPCRQRDVSSA